MNIMRIFLVMTALFWSGLAEAQFETIVVPEGMDFDCEPDWTVQECQDQLDGELYWDEYGDFREQWHDKLLLGVDHFFSESPPSGRIDEDFATPHLVDAQYIRTYRWEYWAFAINDGCDYSAKNCKPVLRMLSEKPDEEIDRQKLKAEKSYFPETPEKLAKQFDELYLWREADLQSCKGALDQIAKFPAQNKKTKFWHPHFLSELKGREVRENKSDDEDEIIVTTHGATVTLRASGQKDPLDPYANTVGRYAVYQHGYYYEGYQWAEEMKEIVEPCLVPSEAPPPWEKVLAYEAANKN